MYVHSASPSEAVSVSGLKDQQVFGVQGYAQMFSSSVKTLREDLQQKGDGAELVWDKVIYLHLPYTETPSENSFCKKDMR